MKEFAGIVLIVGYHFKIVVRSVIERFPAILPFLLFSLPGFSSRLEGEGQGIRDSCFRLQ